MNESAGCVDRRWEQKGVAGLIESLMDKDGVL